MQIEQKSLHFVLDYPDRSPLIVAEVIKDIIDDKVVCDVGCACGDLLFAFSLYCKKAIGVEIDKERVDVARSRGFEVSNFEIPNADVYYIWVSDADLPDILERMKTKKGIMILAEEDITPSLGGKFIEFPIYEDVNAHPRTNWHLQIINLNS